METEPCARLGQPSLPTRAVGCPGVSGAAARASARAFGQRGAPAGRRAAPAHSTPHLHSAPCMLSCGAAANVAGLGPGLVHQQCPPNPHHGCRVSPREATRQRRWRSPRTRGKAGYRGSFACALGPCLARCRAPWARGWLAAGLAYLPAACCCRLTGPSSPPCAPAGRRRPGANAPRCPSSSSKRMRSRAAPKAFTAAPSAPCRGHHETHRYGTVRLRGVQRHRSLAWCQPCAWLGWHDEGSVRAGLLRAGLTGPLPPRLN